MKYALRIYKYIIPIVFFKSYIYIYVIAIVASVHLRISIVKLVYYTCHSSNTKTKLRTQTSGYVLFRSCLLRIYPFKCTKRYSVYNPERVARGITEYR